MPLLERPFLLLLKFRRAAAVEFERLGAEAAMLLKIAAGRVFGAGRLAGFGPMDAADLVEEARIGRFDDVDKVLPFMPVAEEQIPHAFAAAEEVHRRFDPADLPQVEIGGDHLALEPRLPFLPKLDQIAVEEGGEDLLFLLIGHPLLFLRSEFGAGVTSGGPCPGRFGRAPIGLFRGDGAEALGQAAAAFVGGHGERLFAGGAEAFAAFMLQELGDAVSGLADRAAGGAIVSGQREGGDIGALHLRIPAVGALRITGNGVEIEEGAEGGERVLAGEAAGAAAVADDGDGRCGAGV